MPDRTIQFKMHGPELGQDVSAAVFAQKLGLLVAGLKAADKAVNGALSFDYKIRSLHTSEPTAVLYEAALPKISYPVFHSAFDAFGACAQETLSGDRDGALRYGNTTKKIEALAKGAGRKFGYAEIWLGDDSIVRVDPFLGEQARTIVEPSLAPKTEDQGWFKGSVHASFDGRIEAVDLRGALPEITLILSAGAKEIDCVCRAEDIEKIRAGLHHRVRLTGMAIYDGKSGLPRRLQVTDIEPIEGGDFAEWKGSFHPFDVPDWNGDDA